ncbi:hypothetical protein V6615_12205 [Oscillospiraceae bacterium PP1C4]
MTLCLVLLCECGENQPEHTKTPSDSNVPAHGVHALGLTAEHHMDGYEYFWTILQDSYPCWGILERKGLNDMINLLGRDEGGSSSVVQDSTSNVMLLILPGYIG